MLAKWLGRQLNIPPDPNKTPHVNLYQWRDLLRPGLWELQGWIIERGWQQPVAELDMWVEESPPRLAICALWKDGSKHHVYMTPAELQDKAGVHLFKERVFSLTPQSYFDDEVVVAFDEPVNW